MQLVDDLEGSDLFLTTRTHYRRKPQRVRDAEALGIPIYALKGNDVHQMRQCLHTIAPGLSRSNYVQQLQELLNEGGGPVEGARRPRERSSRGAD